MEHELDAIVVRQSGGEVFRAVIGGLAPVLIEVKLAVAIKILKRKTIHLDDLILVHDANHSAVGVGHADPAIAGLLRGPKRLDIIAIDINGVSGRIGGSIAVL